MWLQAILKFGLVILMEILSGVVSDHGTGPRKNGSVNSRSTLCLIERRSCLPKMLLQALIWLFTFCKLSNFFLLDLESIKTLLSCIILWGMWKTDFFKVKVSQWSLQQPSASIRSLAMQGLTGTPKDKKYSSMFSKLELKGLVKPETASSTHYTLHLSKLNISLQCIEELFQYIELWCDE